MTPLTLLTLSLLACTAGKDVALVDDSAPTDSIDPGADADADGTPNAEDCAPDDATRHPGAEELCNTLDDDCDGAVDEDAIDARTWYADGDGDGFGDPGVAETGCTQAGNAVADATDCDDTEAAVNPDGEEICDDRVDNDCDGNADGCRVTGAFEAEDVGSTSEQWASLSLTIGPGCDVTGDGQDDVLVGAGTSTTKYDEFDQRGVVWVFRGGESLPATLYEAWGRAGPEVEEEVFTSPQCLGDTDGNGRAEVGVSAPGAEHDGIYRQGAVYILEFADDGTSPLGDALAVINGTYESQGLHLLYSAGAVTGNGVWDFAAVDATTIWVFNGSFRGDGDTSDAVAAVTPRLGPQGLDLSGDYNGDGIADLASGSAGDSTVGNADIAFGPLSGASRMDEADVNFYLDDEPITTGGGIRLTTANLGDTDGDGRDDVGMIAETKDGMAVYVAADVTAGTHQLSTVASRLTGGLGFGYCLDGAGDIDGDGHTDLIVTEYNFLNIVYGPFVDGGSLDDGAVLQASGTEYTDCAGLGDVTGDGIPDVGMVAPGVYDSQHYEVIDPARLYLVPGSGM